jgi:hypothetical protein
VKDVVKFFAKLPKDFVAKAALPGTTAFEYLNEKRSVYGLIDDPDLLFVIDDKHTDGGILYVFNDHSSVAYTMPKAD